MFRPIYPPRTRAREYCDLAVNIYTGCPHGCLYCYARAMAKRFAGKKHVKFDTPEPRPGIVEAVRRQVAGMRGQGKKIMLCFTCDPYPLDCDSWATHEVIRAIKQSGNHVQILTKGNIQDARRDFSLLDINDSFGVTLTGGSTRDEPGAASHEERVRMLRAAASAGIPTWVSCEPVLNPKAIEDFILELDFVDLWRIGKLNHYTSGTDWRQFGTDVEALCKRLGRNYYIKEDLRKEMEKDSGEMFAFTRKMGGVRC